MTFVQAKICWVSSAGMPIISQMISSGSGAATHSTKSQAPSGWASSMRSTTPAAFVVTYPSTRATSLGVKPFDTNERSRWCLGSSMLIIEPKNSLSSWGMSPMFEPCPEQNSCGLRLAAQTSSWRTSAQ